MPVTAWTVEQKEGLCLWVWYCSKATIWCCFAVEGRVCYRRRCFSSFHMLMWRASTLEEQKHLSRSILEHNLRQEDGSRQIAPTSKAECGFTLSVCSRQPWSRHRALMGHSDCAAVYWKSSLSLSAALSSSAIFVFMCTVPLIKARPTIPVSASVTCSKTRLKNKPF